MDPRQEDELWKEIVENYGDVPSVEDPPGPDPDDAAEEPDDASGEPPPRTGPGVRISFTVRVRPPEPPEPDPDPPHESWEDEGRFVPPPPPPVPAPDPGRLLAWIGLFGAPLLLLVALVAGRPFHGITAVLLAAAFVGGFIHLVRTMPDEPRGPWDDGARL